MFLLERSRLHLTSGIKSSKFSNWFEPFRIELNWKDLKRISVECAVGLQNYKITLKSKPAWHGYEFNF